MQYLVLSLYFSYNYLVVCVDSHKPTSRCIFMMIGGVISWKSAKQILIVTSTIKVTFVSYFKATAYGI